MPKHETRNIIVQINAADLAAMLQGKALEIMPAPPPGKRIVVESQSLPRYRSVRSEVMCEIDLKYHIEDAEPEPEHVRAVSEAARRAVVQDLTREEKKRP